MLSENDVGAFIILNLISIYNKNNSKIISLPKKTELRVIFFIWPHWKDWMTMRRSKCVLWFSVGSEILFTSNWTLAFIASLWAPTALQTSAWIQVFSCPEIPLPSALPRLTQQLSECFPRTSCTLISWRCLGLPLLQTKTNVELVKHVLTAEREVSPKHLHTFTVTSVIPYLLFLPIPPISPSTS